MDFSAFVKSTKQNKIHSVSECFELGDVVNEPMYLLRSSGSARPKSYVHSLSRIQKAVESFLGHFPLEANDKWGACLSTKHVAGFSILARSYFSGIKEPYIFKWKASELLSEVKDHELTVLSLVPAQVFDIVQDGIKAPPSLKYVFVGGAAISKGLIAKAKALGWPLIMCYGATETFAQMSFSKDGKDFEAYAGWTVSLNEQTEILLEGPGLYWGFLDKSKEKPALVLNTEKTFNTKDFGEIVNTRFRINGKSNGLVKIKGSLFDFNEFKETFNKSLEDLNLSGKSIFPVALEEERNGAGLYLVCNQGSSRFIDTLLERHEDFRGAFKLQADLYSAIGKVDKSKLEDELLRTVVSL